MDGASMMLSLPVCVRWGCEVGIALLAFRFNTGTILHCTALRILTMRGIYSTYC
jgi:hypothetical protein